MIFIYVALAAAAAYLIYLAYEYFSGDKDGE